ncbi:2-phosphoxylose phosphatase 1 isoform X2 [Nematostella vectensis]|nr:2-phosphoxylose phosphatase 1 isoform X2 [Nematostella vectensis]
MVQLMIRHGDRSTAKEIPGMEKRDMDCSANPKHGPAKKIFEGYRKVVERFVVRKMNADDDETDHDLVSYSDICLKQGQLTTKGYEQHFDLGKLLRGAYSDLHVKGITKDQVYIRSTSRDRTTQSAAAFIYGFLDLDTIQKGITVNISKDTWFRELDSGLLQRCQAAISLKKETIEESVYRSGQAAMKPLIREIADMLFQPSHALPPVQYITDYVYVFSCQGFELPCGGNGCITKGMALKLMAYANWAFIHNYTKIARVVTHQVFSQMATRMVKSVQRQTPIKFALYSGHDSSITPALIALGIFNGKWIPYASRLVFELWRDKTVDSDKTSLKGWYVRVLFNGEAVTERASFCKGEVFGSYELCPLEVFVNWLSEDGTIDGMTRRYGKMCA